MLEMDAELEQYILAHSEPEGEVLAELSRATHLNVLRPRMLSGNLQGQFLKMICRMIGAPAPQIRHDHATNHQDLMQTNDVCE